MVCDVEGEVLEIKQAGEELDLKTTDKIVTILADKEASKRTKNQKEFYTFRPIRYGQERRQGKNRRCFDRRLA